MNCLGIKEDSLEDLGEMIREECFHRVQIIIEDYMINMKSVFRDLREGSLVKIFGNNEDFIFSESKINRI